MRQDFKKTIFKKHNLIFIKKIKFLARLLALTLFAIFISCNEELYDIKDQHDGVDKNKISLTQFKNETNIGRIDPIVSVPSTKSLSSKTKAQLSDFIIDTLAIKKLVSENNKTTYTFRIYPLSSIAQPNEIYNLVYRKVNNTWETSIFYLKKLPKEDSDHKLFEKIERLDGGKVSNTLTSKTSSAGMCGVETTSVQCDDSCRQEGYPQCDGFDCPTGQCLQRRITWLSCDAGTADGGGSNNTGTTSGPGGGSSGTSDTYSYSPNYYDNNIYEDPNYINEINSFTVWSNLNAVEQDFFIKVENEGFYNETIQYQIDNNWSPESYEFADWARNYKYGNQDVTWSQFENWFATPLEGKDTAYNPAFWDDPNLNFPKQDLPTRLNYLAGMPKFANGDLMTGADNVYNLVGGLVLAARVADRAGTENTCALKTSIALNRSGVIIPNIPGETIEGAGPEFAGKYFFLNAKKLNVWMRETFGTNPATTETPYNAKHLSLTATDGGLKGKNFPTLPALQNVSGIYSIVFKKNQASGHTDYIYTDFDGKIRCPFGCFFNYEFERMDIWILD